MPHNASFGFLDIAGPALGVLRLWTGFELPSSWVNLPGYGSNRNRNILDFMSWHQIDLGAQGLNDIQRPNSFQNNSWK